MIAVLYIGKINGGDVRFFRSPVQGPDLPWHSIDDLHEALKLPRDLRRHFKRRLQGEWKKDVRTVATAGGITTIGPHFMAQGLIGSMVEMGIATTKTEVEYAMAGGEAMKLDMPPGMSPAQRVAQAIAAFQGQGRRP